MGRNPSNDPIRPLNLARNIYKYSYTRMYTLSSLYFKFSSMNSGKTSGLIQAAYNYQERGMVPLIFTSALDTRYGENKVASRVGLEMPAIPINQSDNILQKYAENAHDTICAIFVDEAQFLTREQVLQLAELVDTRDIPVLCYGLRSDFLGNLFDGSAALLAFADKIEEVKSICHCGRKATMNARITDDTSQVAIGGNESYVSMCRKHFLEHIDKKQKGA